MRPQHNVTPDARHCGVSNLLERTGSTHTLGTHKLDTRTGSTTHTHTQWKSPQTTHKHAHPTAHGTHLPGCTAHQTTPTSRPSSAATGQAHTMSSITHATQRAPSVDPSTPARAVLLLTILKQALLLNRTGRLSAWQQAADTTQHVSLAHVSCIPVGWHSGVAC